MTDNEVEQMKNFCSVCGKEIGVFNGTSIGKCDECVGTKAPWEVMNEVFDFVENIFDKSRDPK